DCERMAFIQAAAPRWRWGGYDVSTNSQSTGQFYMQSDRAFLICFPLEKIPKGQKILKAELSFTSILQTPGEQKLHLRRILAPWGPGVCWQYAAVRPKKVEWKQAGARGAGTDRAVKVSAILRTSEAGEKTLNVTEDVELWYSGASANHGWMLTMEEREAYVTLTSPFWGGRGSWKLRITYEPQ
ncbi:MAG TPA: DNRLRE domain-containing protein, partial [Gemmataceae bacterium]|nr:DNRLRE domain-containing protein [Gemmataceae bacterium]